ncbi:hypothetical protein ABK040_005918 [Willaertia magna]
MAKTKEQREQPKATTTVVEQQQTVVTTKVERKSWFKIILSTYFTFAFLIILFLVVLVAHNYLLYQNSFANQYDDLIKKEYAAGAQSKPIVTFQVNLSPAIIANNINNVIKMANDQQFLKNQNIRLPNVPVDQKVNVAIKAQTIPYLALLIAFLFTFTTKLPLLFAQIIEGNGKLDNSTPRAQQSRLVGGFGARTLGSHQNSFEALIGFGLVAVLTIARIAAGTTTTGLNPTALTLAVTLVKESVMFIAARTVFHVLYTIGILPGTLRTVAWAFGWVSVLNLYLTNATI